MSALRFALRLAGRELRQPRRHALLLAAVIGGVAALVAIRSFADNLQGSVQKQARALLGADVALSSNNVFSPAAETVLAQISAAGGNGARTARVTSFGAMAFVEGRPGTRLIQAVAVEGAYPFYGTMNTEPAGQWERLGEGGGVLVDPSLLLSLDAQVGDTLALGEARLPIRGVVTNVPGDVSIRTAFGSRIFLSAGDLAATGLLGFGARMRHEAYVGLPPGVDAQRLADRHRSALARERVNVRTISEDQESINASLGRLSRYLALVGLCALLLGGLGVASAAHALVRRRMDTIAALRCLGATARQLLLASLAQALALGLAGSVIGAALGVAAQAVLPGLVRAFLPVDVAFAPSWSAIAAGLLLGTWVAVVFSLRPLAAIRRVSPLLVIRRDVEPLGTGRRDPLAWAATAAVIATVAGLAMMEAPNPRVGAGFTAALAVAVAALWGAAALLVRAARTMARPGWPYAWRQGVANLHRPANQTLMVVLAMGLGAFLLDTIYVVQSNLLGQLSVDETSARPNFVLFDIQDDQQDGVRARLRGQGIEPRSSVPIVPMRIQAVKGVDVREVLGAPREEERDRGRSPRWAWRREYRSSFADALRPTETTVAGRRWAAGEWKGRAFGTDAVPISMEEGLARELKVGLGDEIVWDVQGVPVRSTVAHLRAVDWGRFEPNFFVVFPEGPLDEAPRSWVTLARVEDAAQRTRLQREMVEAFPNVSAVDLSQIQAALESVVGRAATAIRFMALFTLATGAVVLIGAVAASRDQRLREGALLKALGATRAQVLRIMTAEYASLGVLAASAALVLALGAGWALTRFVFESPFRVPAGPLLGLGAAVVAVTVLVGLWTGREVFARPVLDVLRSES